MAGLFCAMPQQMVSLVLDDWVVEAAAGSLLTEWAVEARLGLRRRRCLVEGDLGVGDCIPAAATGAHRCNGPWSWQLRLPKKGLACGHQRQRTNSRSGSEGSVAIRMGKFIRLRSMV